MIVLLLGCASSDPVPEPVAVAPAPAAVEAWACSTIRHPVVERHTATATLTADGRFTLRHTNTTPEAGTSTEMDGTWTRAPDLLVLTPDSGINRRWRGDGHRYFHGENVPYCAWEEPLAAGERRLAIDRDAEGHERVYLPELQTHLVLNGADAPCDDIQPRPSTVSGGQTFTCTTPPR